MAVRQPSKLLMRVRFPPPAPFELLRVHLERQPLPCEPLRPVEDCIGQILGHSSLAMITQAYQHLTVADAHDELINARRCVSLLSTNHNAPHGAAGYAGQPCQERRGPLAANWSEPCAVWAGARSPSADRTSSWSTPSEEARSRCRFMPGRRLTPNCSSPSCGRPASRSQNCSTSCRTP